MDYIALFGIILVLIAIVVQWQININCVIEEKEEFTAAQIQKAVEQARAEALDDIEVAKQVARNDALNNVERIYSEAELAAKAFGYWEKRVYEAKTDKQRANCYKNARNAQILLIRAAGDFVPDLAKCAIDITVKGKVAQEQRATAQVIPLHPCSNIND